MLDAIMPPFVFVYVLSYMYIYVLYTRLYITYLLDIH